MSLDAEYDEQAAVASDPGEAQTIEFDYIEQEPSAQTALPAGNDDEVVLAEAVAEDKWEREAVEEHLKMVGSMAHELWGKSETDWEMSERDLERISGPLTRILNRYEPTARASIVSDPLLLGYGTTMYAYRSILQRRAASMAAQERAARLAEHDVGTYDVVSKSGSASTNGTGRLSRTEIWAREEAANEGE